MLDSDPSFSAALGRLMKRKRGELRLTQDQLAEMVWPASATGESRKGDISKIENGKTTPNAATVHRIAGALGISEDDLDALQRRAQAPLADQLSQIPALSRDELELLASRFEFAAPHDASDTALKEFLTLKAQEYRAYRAQIDAISESYLALHNLKLAAQDAAARLDFAEVETLLSRVDEVETEAAAQTKVLRAVNALLQGRVDDAFRLYSAAADSFASLAPLAPAHRRNVYATALSKHGLRYGGPGLTHAIALWQKTLTEASQTTDAALWAATQNNLGLALRNQAQRTQGAEGADLLAQAVTAYRAALTVRTQADHPLNWAATQNNLAVALSDQAQRTQGDEGADLLAQAVTAYRAALTVYTQTDHPLNWAMTQNNLAIALGDQAQRTQGAEGADLLTQAVTTYRAALIVYTQTDYPLDWAMTQNNLAIALSDQAQRTQGAEGADLLAEAVTAYRAALTVRTQADHPLDWAMTQNNLALALGNQAQRTQGAEGADLLAEAVTAYRAALTVYTQADHPLNWAKTQNNLALALGDQAQQTQGAEGADLFAQAVTAFRAALTVHTQTDHPLHWAETQTNLAITEVQIAQHPTTPDPIPHLRAALTHVEAALTVFDPVHTAPDHAKASRLRDGLRGILSSLNP